MKLKEKINKKKNVYNERKKYDFKRTKDRYMDRRSN